MTLPVVYRPEEIAQRFGWSARRVRSEAKRLGACLVMGNRMMLTEQDVLTLMEEQRCPSSSTSAARSGITGARLPVGGYADLVKQRTKPLRRERPPKSKPANGNVVSMVRKPF